MLFSSPVFLFIFLPITLALYYILGRSMRNIVLLFASLFFYSWGNIVHLPLLLLSIIINYIGGKAIGNAGNIKKRKLYLTLTLIIDLGILIAFKYTNFAVENLNHAFTIFNLPTLNIPFIGLPIGISFFTFHALSYVIDVYRHHATYQKKLFDLTIYICLFPQLIAGPIIRYHDIADQLENRKFKADQFARGVERFVIGLAKKTILANSFAVVADALFKLPSSGINIYGAWLGCIAYALQIYFDFSGYSCMAIGLARMFGFEFKENFNFPYISSSIKEFWRRWHISLSSWFKDYLYIPLGGNRVSSIATYRNLLIVFFCTGFWHGASWNFLIWGLFHGFFLVIERLGLEKVLEKLPKFIGHIYSLLVVLIGWVFFRADTLGQAIGFLKTMFGFGSTVADYKQIVEYLNPEFILIGILGILGSTRIFVIIGDKLKNMIDIIPVFKLLKLKNIARLAYVFGVIVIFLITLSYMATNSYNPFIYFRF
jgi:alginate O-acetyltransferase complex protein AlgI